MNKLLILLLLVGCSADPVSTDLTNNPEIKVQKLFDHDGCTVYRFHDGDARYFVKCRDGSTRTEWDETHWCGENQTCTNPVTIPG